MLAIFAIDQLRVDADLLTDATYATFQQIPYAKLGSDGAQIHRSAFIGKCRVACDHEQARDTRQISSQILGNPVGKIFLLGVIAHIIKRQHRDGWPFLQDLCGDFRHLGLLWRPG